MLKWFAPHPYAQTVLKLMEGKVTKNLCCYKEATVVYLWCYCGISAYAQTVLKHIEGKVIVVLLQWCHSGITVVSYRFGIGGTVVSRLLLWCSCGLPSLFTDRQCSDSWGRR
jgi:hypothetical protein